MWIAKAHLPEPWNGVHGFLVGVAAGLLVIVIGSFVAKTASRECVMKAWGELR